MATRKILTYPDIRLHMASDPVSPGMFGQELHTLLDDMRETMVASKGVGLAAIQIGEPLNIVVIEYDGTLIEAINPEILEHKGTQCNVEGCLSVPGVRAPVDRALTVEVGYRDREGVLRVRLDVGTLAQIWQHELEHLRGGLYIDNLSNGKLKKLKATYKKANR